MRNGYIPVERIVVRPYEHSEDKYLVIEGNRRLAAIKWILEDCEAGVRIDETVQQSILDLPVIIAEQEAPDEIFRASLMGIRHVSGTKEWGGYQRSKLIVKMRDDLRLDSAEVAERLGLSTQEVNRRYKAFKALQQMHGDEDHGGQARYSMYPLFHEAVSLPVVRTWLGWDEDRCLFTNTEKLALFYDLITPTEPEDGDTVDPKIATKDQVRELRIILTKPEAERVLVDPMRSFQDAIDVSRQEARSHLWVWEIGAAIRSLETMGIKDLKSLSEENISLLQRLARVVEERLEDHRSLRERTEASRSST